jgi:hypothetical protein
MSDQTIAPDQTTAAVPALYDAFARRDLRAGLACMPATSSGTRRRGCRGAASTPVPAPSPKASSRPRWNGSPISPSRPRKW